MLLSMICQTVEILFWLTILGMVGTINLRKHRIMSKHGIS